MFAPESQVRIFVYGQPADMRKSFTGLYALTKNKLLEDPLSGHVFVFINRRGTQLKALYWDRSGFCIWAKKLERGTFVSRRNGDAKRELTWLDFKMLLEGIEPIAIKKRRRFSRENAPFRTAA